jgi:hypothetical protein
MSTAEKLRHNAELIARQVDDDWRAELAAKMGCEISDVGVGPVGRVRDSEPLDVSNFRVLLRDLRSADRRVSEVRFRHWGSGWTEEIAVPLDNPRVVERVEQRAAGLQGYPAADEMDLADLEAHYSIDEDRAEGLLRRLDQLGSSDPPNLGL